MDTGAGVQGFSSGSGYLMRTSANFTTPPIAQIQDNLLGNLRYMLLYDPRAVNTDMDLVEVKHNGNVDAETWSFEVYGYYWDIGALQAPGGPRHPGSS